MAPEVDIQANGEEDEDLTSGLLGLVVTLAEIIQEVLKHQAMNRMKSGSLTDEKCERLGNALMELEQTIEQLKDEHDLRESVNSVRQQLDGVVSEPMGKQIK